MFSRNSPNRHTWSGRDRQSTQSVADIISNVAVKDMTQYFEADAWNKVDKNQSNSFKRSASTRRPETHHNYDQAVTHTNYHTNSDNERHNTSKWSDISPSVLDKNENSQNTVDRLTGSEKSSTLKANNKQKIQPDIVKKSPFSLLMKNPRARANSDANRHKRVPRSEKSSVLKEENKNIQTKVHRSEQSPALIQAHSIPRILWSTKSSALKEKNGHSRGKSDEKNHSSVNRYEKSHSLIEENSLARNNRRQILNKMSDDVEESIPLARVLNFKRQGSLKNDKCKGPNIVSRSMSTTDVATTENEYNQALTSSINSLNQKVDEIMDEISKTAKDHSKMLHFAINKPGNLNANGSCNCYFFYNLFT